MSEKLTEAEWRVLRDAMFDDDSLRRGIGLRRRGRFRTMCERLVRKGLLEKLGDGDTVKITPAGRAALKEGGQQ